jgi:hypothetical protein|tara:strand:- start:1427 stop:1759 length:333 start_codon:yes stop_codon:yes gene_type:complete
MDKAKTKKKKDLYFKEYDLYSDARPKDTIRIKYKTLEDVKSTIKKLERIYKNGTKPHTRISKIANVMNQRLRVINTNDSRYKLSNKYFNFLKERTKLKNEKDRKKLIFKF